VSIPLILKNFERLVVMLVSHPKVEWTTVEGIHKLYGQRPVRVRDVELLSGAAKVVAHGGPTYTSTLSAAELLFLLGRRAMAKQEHYEVPHIMGPLEVPAGASDALQSPLPNIRAIAEELVTHVMASGYLPDRLSAATGNVSLELALLLLACHATGQDLPAEDRRHLSVEAIPGVPEAMANVTKYKDWRIHGPRYHQPGILNPFRLQCWTLKPAFAEREYDPQVELGRHLNPMFERK
jgi:hypothetical protein